MAIVKKPSAEPIDRDERKRPRDCASLAAALDDADAAARRWAARDLVECPGASDALVRRLRLETDSSVREVILTTLTRLGDDVAVDGLVLCLRSEDAALRNEAIQAMKELPDEVAQLMSGILADPDPDVRIFAVNVLESLRHPQVEAWLIGVIDADPHVNVCGTAVDLLAEVGTGASRAALRRVRDRFADDAYIRFAADLALKRIEDD